MPSTSPFHFPLLEPCSPKNRPSFLPRFLLPHELTANDALPVALRAQPSDLRAGKLHAVDEVGVVLCHGGGGGGKRRGGRTRGEEEKRALLVWRRLRRGTGGTGEGGGSGEGGGEREKRRREGGRVGGRRRGERLEGEEKRKREIDAPSLHLFCEQFSAQLSPEFRAADGY